MRLSLIGLKKIAFQICVRYKKTSIWSLKVTAVQLRGLAALTTFLKSEGSTIMYFLIIQHIAEPQVLWMLK